MKFDTLIKMTTLIGTLELDQYDTNEPMKSLLPTTSPTATTTLINLSIEHFIKH